MSFFKNVRNFVSSSLSFAGKSVELLAELAERLERETSILALRATISNLELNVENPALDPEAPSRGRRKELLGKYDELIVMLGKSGDQEVESKRQALLNAERKELVLVLKSEIAGSEKRINKTVYRLPLNEVRDK